MGADATSGCPETVVDLPGFTVLAAGEYGGELELLVETTVCPVHCGQCRTPARAHDRREHLLRDVPVGGRATVLVWWKRIWRCPSPDCDTRTWTEQLPLAAPRSAVTQRAKVWLARRVGADAHTVAGLARELGLGWGTVLRAVTEVGTPLIDDSARLEDVRGLGVDEHPWQHANAHRSTQFATGIVDLTPGRTARLLDVVPGRSGTVYGNWIAQRGDAWRACVRVARWIRSGAISTRYAPTCPTPLMCWTRSTSPSSPSPPSTKSAAASNKPPWANGPQGQPALRDPPAAAPPRRPALTHRHRPPRRRPERRRPELRVHRGLVMRPTGHPGLRHHRPRRRTPPRRAHHPHRARLPGPRGPPPRPHARLVAQGVPGLLRHQPNQQRPHRGRQPARGEDPTRRARLPQLEQLPDPTAPALRRHLAGYRDPTDQEAPSQVNGV